MAGCWCMFWGSGAQKRPRPQHCALTPLCLLLFSWVDLLLPLGFTSHLLFASLASPSCSHRHRPLLLLACLCSLHDFVFSCLQLCLPLLLLLLILCRLLFMLLLQLPLPLPFLPLLVFELPPSPHTNTHTRRRGTEPPEVMTPAGLEPAIPGSVGQCLIHWATGPVHRQQSCIFTRAQNPQNNGWENMLRRQTQRWRKELYRQENTASRNNSSKHRQEVCCGVLCGVSSCVPCLASSSAACCVLSCLACLCRCRVLSCLGLSCLVLSCLV